MNKTAKAKISKAMKKAWAKKKSVVLAVDKIDIINSPPQYTQGTFETITVIEDIIQFYKPVDGNLVSQIIRYLSRAPHKDKYVEDIQKAQWYMDRLVNKYA